MLLFFRSEHIIASGRFLNFFQMVINPFIVSLALWVHVVTSPPIRPKAKSLDPEIGTISPEIPGGSSSKDTWMPWMESLLSQQSQVPSMDSLDQYYQFDYDPNSTDNGYGDNPVSCHDEEKVSFVEKCEPYQENICYSQVQEICRTQQLNDCVSVIQTEVERQCFNVSELVCNLRENIDFFLVREEYLVQVCFVVKEQICDTTQQLDLTTRDDFQCTKFKFQNCESTEAVLKDVTCKKTVEFQCRKEKRTNGGYGMETVCVKTPRESCYDTPRTVGVCTVLYCIVLYCTVLFCSALYFT